jgi:hypothetical protein
LLILRLLASDDIFANHSNPRCPSSGTYPKSERDSDSNVRAAHASPACASEGVALSGVVKIARGRCGRVLRERLNTRTAARHRSVSAAKSGGVFSRDVVLQLLNGHFLLRDDPLY